MWKYCDTISIFPPSFFYPPHMYRISFFFFFPFFFPSSFLLHTRTLTLFFFHFFPLFIPTTSSKLQNILALCLPFFFFFLALCLQHPCNSSPWSSWFFSFFSKFNYLQTGWFRSGRVARDDSFYFSPNSTSLLLHCMGVDLFARDDSYVDLEAVKGCTGWFFSFSLNSTSSPNLHNPSIARWAQTPFERFCYILFFFFFVLHFEES